jgi:extracellular factor (EF) 3-hydroxypalmitic acid methyl ester biosynthesis protein
MTSTFEQPRSVLERAVSEFADGIPTSQVMKELEAALQHIRSQVPSEDWKSSIVPEVRRHAIMDFLMQDPFTRRSFQKPRGYPGDAELLDMAYLEPDAPPASSDVSALGREIFEYTSGVVASKAVRSRKQVLTREIDSVLHRVPASRVLSVACGHLRELKSIQNHTNSMFAEFIAFDQDAISLKTVEHDWSHLGVRPLLGGVKHLFQNDVGRFDLIYAAGLYDYLQTNTARTLTARLFALLKPGGVLLVANFLPDIWESGYMEAAMDWWLLQRSLPEIGAFLDDTPSQQIAKYEVCTDAYDRIGYLKAIRT